MTATTLFAAAPEYAAADGTFSLAWLLIAIPLLSAGILLVAGRKADKWGHVLGVVASAASFIIGAMITMALLGLPAADRLVQQHLFSWVPAGSFEVSAGLRIDPLSLTFVLLVTFVGTLIHIYSVAYMAQDTDRRRFFAYLNLFVAAMLILVLADSYLVLYLGWEGVGLASYLLIGFWNHNRNYAVAAKKAFIVNRVGDVGLAIAIMLMFVTFGAVDFDTVLSGAGDAGAGLMTATGLMLLLAACAKSAQFPLQSWLGDAMAGPTPVSALIHAATMVTAGVYLIVRSGVVFEAAPTAQLVVIIVGAITLIFGAIIGCAKDDLKKALAASTMSQIGYMVLAAGLGPVGYAFAIFHLVTHGFFKAGMFLGAGSVMHGMNDEVDMRRFGNLRTAMKITWITFGLGWLAIIGVPPFSGFWSKDGIIEAAFVGDGVQPWIVGSVTLIGVALTSFYMSRMFFMTFHGEDRWAEEQNPKESPSLMTVPMIILAVGSVALGGLLMINGAFTSWLEPITGVVEHGNPVIPVPAIMVSSLVLVIIGGWLAWRQYGAAPVPVTAPVGSVMTRAARQDLYQDQVNEALLMYPGQYLTRALVYADSSLVDGATTGLGRMVASSGEVLRRLQTGFVRSYAATMLAGVVIIVAVVLATRV